ncbi:MAG: hypothetical protein R6W91_06785, partial [Thermoplasmata archaeon]
SDTPILHDIRLTYSIIALPPVALYGDTGTNFGWSVAGAGNINGDGTNKGDVVIGAPGYSTNTGRAYAWLDGDFESSSSIKNDTQAEFNTGSFVDTYATAAGDVNLTSDMTYYIDDDFESNDVGVNPAGWTCQLVSYTSVVNTPTHSGNRSVRFTDSSTTYSAFMSQSFTGTTLASIEFWIYYTVTTKQYNVLIMDSIDTYVVTQLAWLGSNVYYFYDDGAGVEYSVIGSYTSGNWQHIKMICDSDTDKIDIYIDDMDTPAVSQGNFYEPTDDIGFIQFATISTERDGTFYIDDVQVYSGTGATLGYYDSVIATAPYYIKAIKPYWNLTIPSGTSAWINVSRDGGATWNQSALTNGNWYTFPTEVIGSQLCYNVTMISEQGIKTPILHDISIEYLYCTHPSVTLTGQSTGDRFGFSVHGAGDIDGDGYDDIIIGAPYNENNGTGAGAVYIFNGSASMDAEISASNADYIKNGTAGSHFGWSVGYAGDLDDDGHNDVIVGAPDWDSATEADIGWVQVLCVIPEYSAELIAILIPFGLSVIIFRKRRKSKHGERQETSA